MYSRRMSTYETFNQSTPIGDIGVAVTRHVIDVPAAFNVPYEGANSLVQQEFPDGFSPSYGSGLAFKGVDAAGNLEFYCLTDRGPNGDGTRLPSPDGSGVTDSKIFPAPRFIPSIGVFKVGIDGAVLAASWPIRMAPALMASGLPLPPGTAGTVSEIALHDTLQVDPAAAPMVHPGGIDSEAIAFDRQRGVLWITDEYGPFLMKIDAAGVTLQARYAPGNGLPAILAKRRANRGMEGMALDVSTDKLHGFLQSPLSDGNATYAVTGKSEAIERFARFTRWVEFDPVTGTSGKMYAYPLDGSEYQDGRTGSAKLGDMVALGNGKFIVIEQGAGPSGKVFNRLMLVELAGATDISAAAYNVSTSDLEKSSMAGAAVNGAAWSSVAPLKKTLLLDLNAIGWLAEKAEGLTLVDGATLALANDNDFGMKTKVFNAAGEVIADADVTKCNVTAAGTILTSTALGCDAANTIRVARGDDRERPSRLWLIKFGKALTSF
jgi:hypothetical protein